jgi:hypothetical protein
MRRLPRNAAAEVRGGEPHFKTHWCPAEAPNGDIGHALGRVTIKSEKRSQERRGKENFLKEIQFAQVQAGAFDATPILKARRTMLAVLVWQECGAGAAERVRC